MTWLIVTLGRATLTDGWDGAETDLGASEDKFRDVLADRLGAAFPEHSVVVRLENSDADLEVNGVRWRDGRDDDPTERRVAGFVGDLWEDQDAWVVPAGEEARRGERA